MPVTQDAVAYWYAKPGAQLDGAVLDTCAFKITEIESVSAPSDPGPSTCQPK